MNTELDIMKRTQFIKETQYAITRIQGTLKLLLSRVKS